MWEFAAAEGGRCDHIGSLNGRRYTSTEIPGRKTVRSNFEFEQSDVSRCSTVAILRVKKRRLGDKILKVKVNK